MSLWSRLRNAGHPEKIDSDIDEELRSHLDEAQAAGRDARAFGSVLRMREAVRDAVVAPWLDSLRADLVFGWRQLRRHKTASAAAILSLGLAIGSSTAAFRIIDALLLRPLPVSNPERLYVMGLGYVDENGKDIVGYFYNYPGFEELRATVAGSAELIAIAAPERINLIWGNGDQTERVSRQYVSGWMFDAFGLRPALGRLFTAQDDVTPGAHPLVVISYDYWTRRFAGSPDAIGRTFRSGNDVYRIVGVAPKGFTGTDTGRITDLYVPTMMQAEAIRSPQWTWIRTWVQLKPGIDSEQVRQRLRAVVVEQRRQRARGFPPTAPKAAIDKFIGAPIVLESAVSGLSDRQGAFGRPLVVLGVLVALILLISCANVANLMAAQAAARAREMALRVSIGAGRRRLVQLVMLECSLVAALASILGFVFAWWAAPVVVGMLEPPDDPIRLIMPADGRVAVFGASLAFAVALLFGLLPAFRASFVQPAHALKGGDPRTSHRAMHVLVGLQVAFCFLVHFNAGLFVSTFQRMTNQSLGFDPKGVITVETVTNREQPVQAWYEVARQLNAVPGVDSASVAGWALMAGGGWNMEIVANGRSRRPLAPWFLGVSPGWLATMKIPRLEGRDFRSDDVFPRVAAVNQEFARLYFDGKSPVGRTLETTRPAAVDEDAHVPTRVVTTIVAVVGDARYSDMRQPIQPTVYVPLQTLNEKGQLQSESWATFVVRSKGDPFQLASALRKETSRANPAFRVAMIRGQEQLVNMHTIRERMLAALSLFFAFVSLVLAAVGIYGVLDYAVQQRRREFGIRIALGARMGDIARRVTAVVFGILALGALAGLATGIASERYVQALLFGVKATDPWAIAIPLLTILSAALLAAIPPVIRAVRTDPTQMLRAE